MRTPVLITLVAAATISGGVYAQTSQSPGETSGPAAGGNVDPTTAVQKNRSSSQDATPNAPAAGGAPGVEGHKGSKSGPAEESPKKNMQVPRE